MYLAVLTNGKVELILDIKNSWILTPLQNTLSSIASHSSLVYYWCFTIWDKVFKRGLSKFFKGCLPQNLLSPLLNTLSHMFLHCLFTSKGLPCSILVSNTVWKVSVFGVFLVRIFPYLDWIQKDTEHLSVFSKNVGKYGPKKLRLRTLFTQWGFSEKMQIGWRAYFNIMIYLSWYLAMKIYARRYIC